MRFGPLVLAGLIALGAAPLAAEEATLPAIRNARVPMDDLLTGGQPTREQLAALAASGFKTVINLRRAEEPGFEWEAAHVKSLEMTYVHLPVAGAKGMTRENAEALHRALTEARTRGPVLLHCASGNRVGALLGLGAYWRDEMEAEAALGAARAWGMTSLTPVVTDLLGEGR